MYVMVIIDCLSLACERCQDLYIDEDMKTNTHTPILTCIHIYMYTPDLCMWRCCNEGHALFFPIFDVRFALLMIFCMRLIAALFLYFLLILFLLSLTLYTYTVVKLWERNSQPKERQQLEVVIFDLCDSRKAVFI